MADLSEIVDPEGGVGVDVGGTLVANDLLPKQEAGWLSAAVRLRRFRTAMRLMISDIIVCFVWGAGDGWWLCSGRLRG